MSSLVVGRPCFLHGGTGRDFLGRAISIHLACIYSTEGGMVRLDAELADSLCDALGGRARAPNFSRMLESAAKIHRKRTREEAGRRNIVATRGDILFRADTTEFASPSVKGMDLLNRFERFLEKVDELYMSRSISQRDFHKHFTVACLPHIVGEEEWERHRSVFLKKMEEDEFKSEVMVTTPRRFGKTTAVAMFVAGLMCCCERMWCSIFSTGKRASKSLMQQIKEVIDCFPCMANRTISSNVEELVMQPLGTSGAKGTSRCFSYPSSVKVSLRRLAPGFLVYTYLYFFCILFCRICRCKTFQG